MRYPDSRAGLLSHATFLSNSSKFDDTSPVYRGQTVNTRLLCRTIPDPPPDVDVDSPGGRCRSGCLPGGELQHGRAFRLRAVPPVHGSDRIRPWSRGDRTVAFVTMNPDRPECPLDGARQRRRHGGVLRSGGTRTGPSGLGGVRAVLRRSLLPLCDRSGGGPGGSRDTRVARRALQQRLGPGRVHDRFRQFGCLSVSRSGGVINAGNQEGSTNGTRNKTPFITHRVPVLKRRTFLRSTLGAAVALPWLEIMLAPNAKAQSRPFRYLISTGGISQRGSSHGMPSAGALTQLPRLYEAFAPIQSKVSLVNRLTIPQGPRDNLPPGGTKTSPGHYGGWARDGDRNSRYREPGTRAVRARTTSWPRRSAGQTPFDVLRYQAQPSGYAGGVLQTAAGPGGRPINSITSPRLAYDQLFAGFNPGSETDHSHDPSAHAEQWTRRGSQRARCGQPSQHAHSLRSRCGRPATSRSPLRRGSQAWSDALPIVPRIGGTGTTSGTGPIAACERLPDPGADPGIDNGTDYSNEDLRNDIFGDLVAMAFRLRPHASRQLRDDRVQLPDGHPAALGGGFGRSLNDSQPRQQGSEGGREKRRGSAATDDPVDGRKIRPSPDQARPDALRAIVRCSTTPWR